MEGIGGHSAEKAWGEHCVCSLAHVEQCYTPRKSVQHLCEGVVLYTDTVSAYVVVVVTLLVVVGNSC